MVVLLALLAAVGLAKPTVSPSDCLWEAAGPTQRHAWLSQYDSDPSRLVKTGMAKDRTAALAVACGIPTDRVRHLLIARALEVGAEAWWDRDMQQPGALARSWAALTEAERAQMRLWAATAIDDGNGDELDMDGLPAFARGAGMADPNGRGMMHLMGYMLGRGYRELTGGQ